jgi:ABC-type antimicrobial peptide transport system permease subunit
MLMLQSLKPIVAGVLIGIAGGFGLSRLFNSMFWRIATVDPWVMGGIAAVMLTVALFAAWVPVNRVTRIDPQAALRQS